MAGSQMLVDTVNPARSPLRSSRSRRSMPGPRGLAPISRAQSTSSNAFSASMEIWTCRTKHGSDVQKGQVVIEGQGQLQDLP